MKTFRCNCGESIYVDDNVFDVLSTFKWHCTDNTVKSHVNKDEWLILSHFIIEVFKGQRVDHKDQNIHNNVRSNLRIATAAQNACNTKQYETNTTGLRGVGWHKRSRKWRATITHHKQSIHIGLFDSKEEAAVAYNQAALQLHKEFATLNQV